MNNKSIINTRSAGILLPITSLPSPYGIGSLGKEAYRFIDFMIKSGQKAWQILPIGPTSYGNSPYQSFSAFAGNPYFIDLDELIKENLLIQSEVQNIDWGNNNCSVDYEKINNSRYKILKIAFNRFKDTNLDDFNSFCEANKYWLEDYSIFMAVKEYFDDKIWLEWDNDIRLRKIEALIKYKSLLVDDIFFWKFIQYKFYEQWNKLKSYANENGISIIGDLPIYVALDSADTWGNSEQFLLDENHFPTVVAGVPPDDFSEDGQLWGNAIYDWTFMEKDNFNWWKKRIAFSSKNYDVIRIDHFIGFVRYYAIPSNSQNAKTGCYMDGPGMKLISAINQVKGDCDIIAEDLGIVTDDVKDLIKKSGYPGMKVLQFAFGSDCTNDHLPINYEKNSCVYVGTHDNDTIVSAFEKMPENIKNKVLNYIGKDNSQNIAWDFIRLAYSSVSNLAVIQMQDILELDSSARMNTPSTVGSNWKWRVDKDVFTDELAEKLKNFVTTYGR